MNRFLMTALLLHSIVTLFREPEAAVIQNIYFPDSVKRSSVKLTLRGTSVLNYLLVVKAYAGALYVQEKKQTLSVLQNTARRLELRYFVKIKAEGFSKATTEMIKKTQQPQSIQV